MNNDWDTIEFLRHVRHDWLNKIQIIKGNIDLNRTDRVKEIIHDIIMESKQEAKLSNLNLPQFSTFILTCNWQNYYFQVEYEVLNDDKCVKIDDCVITKWTTQLFEEIHQHVKAFHDNHLSISIEPLNKGMRLFFDLSGIIENRDHLEKWIKGNILDTMTICQSVVTKNELVVELTVCEPEE